MRPVSFASNSLARRFAWVAAVHLLCSGCFAYVATELDTVPPGEDVRVHLTQEGLGDLAEFSPGVRMDGTLLRADGDQLVLRVPIADQTVGIMTRTLGQDVTIPSDLIARLERRQFDRTRTWLTAGVGVAGVVSLLMSFGEGIPNPDLPPVEEDPAGFTAARALISRFSISVR